MSTNKNINLKRQVFDKMIEAYPNDKIEQATIINGVAVNNEYNYNCSFQTQTGKKNPVLITKNPLVRLSHDGKNLAVDYNNILSPESYQNNSKYRRCEDVSNNNTWWERNRNMIGIYDIEFSNKWFMVSIVMI